MWAVRVGSGDQRRRIFIRAPYGTPEFQAEYEAALRGGQTNFETARACPAGSVKWLIDRYRETHAWTSLAAATRRQRENICRQVISSVGDVSVTRIAKSSIVASRDSRSATPAQGRHYLQAMRGLFRWALQAGHVKVDPTDGVEDLRAPGAKKAGGFPIWTDDDVEKYARRWPVGTRQRVSPPRPRLSPAPKPVTQIKRLTALASIASTTMRVATENRRVPLKISSGVGETPSV
jgi:hypothetical protein